METSLALPPVLEARLSEGDDPALWVQVLKAVAVDASVLQVPAQRSRLYAEVGACSHWLRPHQTRWTAAGGFAFPSGYGHFRLSGLPGFDWSVKLQFDSALPGWIVPGESQMKRFNSVRIAIPARTTRHRQAAIHSLWSPGTLDAKQSRPVLYGFRNLNGIWELVARKALQPRS